MTTPHKEAILEKAKELFMEHSVKNGIEPISPTESELKEGGYFAVAQSMLMQDRNRAAIEEYFVDDRFNTSGFQFDVEECCRSGFYCSGTSGVGKSDVAMNAVDKLLKANISVIVFDSTQDWVQRSSIPYYITIKHNLQFKFALDGCSFIFDVHLLPPEKRLELVNWFCGILYRHQALRPKALRKKFVVILEEAQTYLYEGSMRTSKKASNIRMLLTEGRNYDVRFAAICQFSSMLSKISMKFMRQRYCGWTDEPNDVDYVTNLLGGHKEKLKSLKAGEFLYKHGNAVNMISIEPYASNTKPQPLHIQPEQQPSETLNENERPIAKLNLVLNALSIVFFALAILVSLV